jgi:hypothetical protein
VTCDVTVRAPISAVALVRRLAAAGVVLRVEGRFLVARGPIRALFGAIPELRARRDELRAYLKPSKPEAAA